MRRGLAGVRLIYGKQIHKTCDAEYFPHGFIGVDDAHALALNHALVQAQQNAQARAGTIVHLAEIKHQLVRRALVFLQIPAQRRSRHCVDLARYADMQNAVSHFLANLHMGLVVI